MWEKPLKCRGPSTEVFELSHQRGECEGSGEWVGILAIPGTSCAVLGQPTNRISHLLRARHCLRHQHKMVAVLVVLEPSTKEGGHGKHIRINN